MLTSSHVPASKAPPQIRRRGKQTNVTSASVTAPPVIPSTRELKYELTKQEPITDDDYDYDDDYDNFVVEEAQAYGRKNFGTDASPCIMPFVYNRRFLDTQMYPQGW